MARLRKSPITMICWLAAFLLGAAPFFGHAMGPTAKQPLPASGDLAQVPEVSFEPTLPAPVNPAEAQTRIANNVKKANQLNKQRIDGFVHEVRKTRPDLRGLPFVMGDDCRMAEECLRAFAAAGEGVHQALDRVRLPETKRVPDAGTVLMGMFQRAYWEAETKHDVLPNPDGFAAQALLPKSVLLGLYVQQGVAIKKAGPELAKKPVAQAQIAALMQVLAPEAAELRVGLANYLARMPHREATQALAKLAIFSEEREVRQAACKALQPRNSNDYKDILASGLSYPWPAVAERATEAIVQLKGTEFIPQLVGVLEQPDPRSPQLKEIDGKKLHQMRELVRINHHRNCLLCHAPGNTADIPKEAVRAEVVVPGEPFQSFSSYQQPPLNSDFAVRIDVTYLRQDFSRFLPVKDAAPWPEQQRFDFLVRTRMVTAGEAQAYREAFQAKAGGLSPYHQTVVVALRELTGRDAEPTAAAWRKVLGMKKGG